MRDAFEEIIKLQLKLRDTSLRDWFSNEVFKWNWWLGITIFIAPFFIWWKLVDKKRIIEIVLYGCIISLISNFLDIVGHDYGLWDYQILLLPNIHHFIEVDSSAFPVIYMLVYQYFPSWKKFVFASIITAAVSAFVIEPFFVWMKLYDPINWRFIYSFPIYILLAVSGKCLMNTIKKVNNK